MTLKKPTDMKKLEQMCNQGMTLREMAIRTGLSTTTVSTRLKAIGMSVKAIPKYSSVNRVEMLINNHQLNECEKELLKTMKENNYDEARMAYMLGMDVSYLKEQGYL